MSIGIRFMVHFYFGGWSWSRLGTLQETVDSCDTSALLRDLVDFVLLSRFPGLLSVLPPSYCSIAEPTTGWGYKTMAQIPQDVHRYMQLLSNLLEWSYITHIYKYCPQIGICVGLFLDHFLYGPWMIQTACIPR